MDRAKQFMSGRTPTCRWMCAVVSRLLGLPGVDLTVVYRTERLGDSPNVRGDLEGQNVMIAERPQEASVIANERQLGHREH